MSEKRIASSPSAARLIDAAETAFATATTVAFRWPQFLYDILDPTHPMSAETRRAFTEKATVMMEASLIAVQAWQKLWIEMLLGEVKTQDFHKKVINITTKSAAPARQRVRANAKRLTTKHLSGR